MSEEGQAWASRASELADLVWEWVNRTDCWGGYHSLSRRGQSYIGPDGAQKVCGKCTTRPWGKYRGRVHLNRSRIRSHFRATPDSPQRLVGLHAISPASTSRWGAIEIDQHGPDGEESRQLAQVNLAAALAWYSTLTAMGFRPLLTDSNGAGGYHLRILLSEWIDSARLHAFLRQLVSDHARYGLGDAPETFPKQPAVTTQAPCGNWLRLPGCHHSRAHWSRVWDGSTWLKGHQAIDCLLSFHPNDNPNLIPLYNLHATNSNRDTPRNNPPKDSTTPPEEGRQASSIRYACLRKLTQSSELEDTIIRIINRCTPKKQGQRNSSLMRLVASLRLLDIEWTGQSKEKVFWYWWSQAMPHIGTDDPVVSHNDYHRAWQAPTAVGLDWEVIAMDAARERLPEAFYGKPETYKQLARAVAVLQRLSGKQPFFLSCECAQKKLGIPKKTAHRALRWMVEAGLLLMVGAKGSHKTGLASCYLCLWLKGEATWPDASTSGLVSTGTSLPTEPLTC